MNPSGQARRALALDLGLALDLASDRALALDLALDLSRELDLASDRALALDLNRASARASDLASEVAFELALDLNRASGRASGLASGLARDLARDLGRRLDLARASALASDRAALAHDLDRACGLAHDLALDLTVGRDLARRLARARADGSERGEAGRVAPSAAGLLAAAARLLPAADRTRYAEEYHSELWDLAQSGARRPRQLGYALRQLRSGLSVGLALRTPRRRGAAP